MKVLVLVDLQNDFIDGSLGTKEAQAIVPKVVEKLENYPDKSNTLILFTKDTHHYNYLESFEGKNLPVEHCIENTSGWSINKEISRAAKNKGFLTYSSDMIINSRIYKSEFGSEILMDFFINHVDLIEEVEFIGLCTDVCVVTNALMARTVLPHIKISVDETCCAGTTPEKHLAALEVMKSCQIDIIGE